MKSKESFALTTGLSIREPAGLVLLRASPSGSARHRKNIYFREYLFKNYKIIVPTATDYTFESVITVFQRIIDITN